jgi:hypothetical protein
MMCKGRFPMMKGHDGCNPSKFRTVIECGLIGAFCGSSMFLLNAATNDLTPRQLTWTGLMFFGVYGGINGALLASSMGALAKVTGYDKRFPWLLRFIVVILSTLICAVGSGVVPFTLPLDGITEPIP